jgi:IclR family acetate operon transcriptional repressor
MVRSIDRGFDVMQLLAQSPEPMALAEITSRLRLPRTTAFNIVRTLTKRGAVELIPHRGYHLGPLVTDLARARAPSQELIPRLRPFLEEIAARTGETALLSVVSGDEIVFIDKVESPQAIRYTVQVGTRRPMYCSAHGKVALAALSNDEVEGYLLRTPLTAQTAKTIVDSAALKRELARIQRLGHAMSDGEFILDVFSVSVPLLRRGDGVPLGMISAVGPMPRIKPNRRMIASLLMELASRASDDCRDLAGVPEQGAAARPR